MLVLILIVLLFNTIAYSIPKRLTPIEMLTTTLFAMLIQLLTDIYLSLKYNIYGYFEKGPDWESFIYILGIYPAVNIIFLNCFPYKKRLRNKVVYVFVWVVLAMIFETIFIWSGTFYLNGWKQSYSIFTYPVLYVTLLLFHQFTVKLVKRSRRESDH